ncbi:hypothetical protein I2I05_19725 [Hymenobacter sp. BT683]|uniref:Uncharacterized protein n=1 Tax=Hymenobacter jeongseonensis TaxID=2791027 RepID=A0ABS0IMQ5_9BACT|nr:hypothetical protein [Hymenobacter jeongseonensis]MBF9239632.1 hypothetical protein [Hymenobacter jeongseonensis]
MSQVLNGQDTASERGGSIQQAALEVSKHPVLKQEAPLVLHAVALAQSVQQLVKLELHPLLKKSTRGRIERPGVEAPPAQAVGCQLLGRRITN